MERRRALLVLAGLILLRGFAGGCVNMTAGLFLSPVSQELGVGVGVLSLYLSVMSAVSLIWLPMAGGLARRVPVKPLAAAAAAFQGLSFAALGALDHVSGWYLLAIPQAMGAAILVNLLGPILLSRWFPHNTGTALGIQMAFVYLFAAVSQPVASGLIASAGWRRAYPAIGLTAFAAEAAAGLLLLRDRPEAGAPSPPRPAVGKNAPAAESADSPALEIPEESALRSASFLFLLGFIIAMTGAAVFTQHLPTYGGLLGYSPGRVGAALSLASLGSALGAMGIGLICDRIGGLRTCCGIIALWLLAVAGFLFAGADPLSRGSFPVFAGAAFLHGAACSSIPVLAPMLTMTFYGKGSFENIYAKVTMGAPLSSILLVPAYGFFYDFTGSYAGVLAMLAVLLCAAFLAIRLGWRTRCTAEGCPVWPLFRRRAGRQ